MLTQKLAGGSIAPLHRCAQQPQRSTRALRRGASALPALVQPTRVTIHNRSSRLVCQADMMAGLKKMLGQAGGAAVAAARPAASYLGFEDTAPSWQELQAVVDAKRQQLGMPVPDLEAGPTNPMSLRRTFGEEGEPKITLYRDHAAWCPYCEKVVLQLEEKRIPYIVSKVNMRCYGDKPPEFMRKVPSGLLPVLEYQGRIITESAVIARILENDFPGHTPLLPPEGTPELQRAEGLMKLERQLFGAWLQWLCQPWAEEQHRAAFESVMDRVDAEMGAEGGPYFLGADLSLVDIIFAPFLERIAASMPYYKGYIVRGKGRFPNLEKWFEAMETREAYLGMRSDYYTHVHDLPPQLGGCMSVPAAEATAAAIDGTDGVSWRLPLPPLSSSSLPEPYSPGERPEADRLEAAAKLVGNHAAVTKFALRGAGRPGPRPVSAPLSDPTAIPAGEHSEAADAALRHVAHALLEGVEAKQGGAAALAAGGGLPGAPVAASLAYLRDRVGVPRDMKYPAARQLRAHINWFIDTITE